MGEGEQPIPESERKFQVDPRTGTVESVPEKKGDQIKEAERIQETREK